MFHGRVPYNVLDLKVGLKQSHNKDTTTDTGEEVLQKTRLVHESVSKHLLHSYIRYKKYCERNASAHPLEVNEFCYALHPQANDQGSKIPFWEYLWTGPYIVVPTLPYNKYLIRKLQTNKTQTLPGYA